MTKELRTPQSERTLADVMSSGRHPLNPQASSSRHRRALPHRLKLLCIGQQEPPWPLLALRLETAGCDQAEFEWQSASADVLGALRKKTFDAIVLCDEPSMSRSESSALELVEAIRAIGTDDPIAVVLAEADDDRILRLDEFNCEVLISAHGWHSRALVATLRRSVMQGDIFRDVAALENAAQRGRVREREEAEAQLRQLRALLDTHRELAAEPSVHKSPWKSPVPGRPATEVGQYYGELLRTYVMMGSGNLSAALRKLAEVLSLSGTSTHDALSIHVHQVESLLQGLGSRSSRHIMARADLLALELMLYLGDCYRRKPRFRGLGDGGVDLLHAETLLRRETESRE